MKEQKISGTGGQQGHAAPFRVWAPIVISALALVISTLGFMVQQSALDQQREQLAAQNGQLDTQKNQLDIQRNALETQQKEFQAAEDRWKAEGPLFVARGYLRQDPERSMALLDFSEDGPAQRSDEELENIYVSEGQAEIGPMFIEAEVTNVGRSPGQISSVWGELNGYRKDSRPLSPAPGIRICTATLGNGFLLSAKNTSPSRMSFVWDRTALRPSASFLCMCHNRPRSGCGSNSRITLQSTLCAKGAYADV